MKVHTKISVHPLSAVHLDKNTEFRIAQYFHIYLTHCKCTKSMHVTLTSFYSWLREQHSLNTISRLFSLPVQQRVRTCITNPIYQSNNKRDRRSRYKTNQTGFLSKKTVDIFVKNPLFGCEMVFGEKVI